MTTAELASGVEYADVRLYAETCPCGATVQMSDHSHDSHWGDWGRTPSGNTCLWCAGSEYEPLDADDAEMTLCRGHLAEYEGTSLDGLDREDTARYADYADLYLS